METVGDKYMCVSGLPDKSERHAHNIAHLAIDMMKVSKDVTVRGRNIVVSKFLSFFLGGGVVVSRV